MTLKSFYIYYENDSALYAFCKNVNKSYNIIKSLLEKMRLKPCFDYGLFRESYQDKFRGVINPRPILSSLSQDGRAD